MTKKEHRVKVKIQRIYIDYCVSLSQLVQDFQEILKEYPDAWIDYEYGYDNDRIYEIFGTREETEVEKKARLDLAKKNREAAKKAKEVQQAKELEMLAKLKAKYEKE